MQTVSLGDVRYNATACAFEACADVQSGTQTFRYPCEVVGPMTMDMKRVRAGLEQQARRMSVRGSGLLSHS